MNTAAIFKCTCDAIQRRCEANSRAFLAQPYSTTTSDFAPCAERVVLKPGAQRVDFARLPPEPITYFHSAIVCGASLHAYACHLARVMPPANDAATLLGALVLFDRFQATTRIPVTVAMMHRLFVTSLLMSSKALADTYIGNSSMAYASQLDVEEINRLEVTLLVGTEWRVSLQQPAVEAMVAWAWHAEQQAATARRLHVHTAPRDSSTDEVLPTVFPVGSEADVPPPSLRRTTKKSAKTTPEQQPQCVPPRMREVPASFERSPSVATVDNWHDQSSAAGSATSMVGATSVPTTSQAWAPAAPSAARPQPFRRETTTAVANLA